MTDQIIKKRSPFLAAIFSLLSPGLGHLYVGKWKLAIAIPFILIFLMGLMGWSRLIFNSYGMSLLIVLMILAYLVVIISAFRYARNNNSQPLNASQRWYYYLVFLIAFGVLNSSLVDYRGKLFGFEPFRIPASSMVPALLVNDFVIVDVTAYHKVQPQHGDVIVFDYPRDPQIKYIKRVIAKAGDHVAYADKILYLNGQPVKREELGIYTGSESVEPMTKYREYLAETSYEIMHIDSRPAMDFEYIVPDNSYFVLGDHRDNSNDSRYWGVVPHDYLYGKAEYIWLSIDDNGNIRSDRTGMRL